MLGIFFNAVSAVFVLLLLMLVGYLMGKAGWMGKSEKTFLGKYLMNVAVPCNCLVGLLNNLDHDLIVQSGGMVAAAMLSVSCNFLMGMVLASLLKLPQKRWGVFVSMVGLSNSLFIGMPLSTQLFGESCLPYVVVYYMSSTIFTQSAAVILVERSGTASVKTQNAGDFLKNIFTKPPIVAIFLSISMLLVDFRPPALIMSFAKYISGSVSPLALIYCGFIVYELGFKNLRFEKGLPLMLVCRLMVAPLICVAFCQLFNITGLAYDVFVVESALPVVSQITVMAGSYGADDKYSASGATLSTIGAFFTIPILMVILG